MTEAQLVSYAITGVVILGSVILVFVYLWILRNKYHKLAENKVRLQIIGKDDNEHVHWGHIDSLNVVDDETDTPYALENVKWVDSWYPAEGLFRSLGAKVKKGIFDEGFPEAYVKENYNKDPVNTTDLGKWMRKERFLTVASGVMSEIEDKLNKAKKGEVTALAWWMVNILLIAGMAFVGYSVWMLTQKMAALGV